MKPILTPLLIIVCFLSGQAQLIHENDIVINEIMADPTPSIALPEWEFVELYNTSDSPINIVDWKLMIGDKELQFDEDVVVQADDYLILCHDDAVEELSDYGSCHGFSSFQITNSGINISLINKNDDMISSVEFDVSWHSASFKEEGGWSLEQIDASNPCAGRANWSSSNSNNGGTPGKVNSITNENVIPIKIEHINPIANNELEIFFNQNMNIESLQDIENYIIDELELRPSKIDFIKYKNDYVKLTFDFCFEEGLLYTINIENVRNCKDIPLENEISIQFGIPSSVKRNDIIINEILFNPISPGVDYLELYNRSKKVVDLSEILFGTVKESFPNSPDTMLKEICSESRILLPNSYIVLSTNSEIIKYQYDVYEEASENFLEVESFPTFSNEEGNIIICDRNRDIIDEMSYSEKMHYDLLSITQGIALERISSENPSTDKNNWHSASYNHNYGTPGYRNSMAIDVNINGNFNKNEINITPEIFSPDGDAFDDICCINYNFDRGGYSLNIRIFNSEGILIKVLMNNNLVSDEGTVFWDGCDDNNRCVTPGIYIIQTEIFDLEGNVKRFRNVVVVATK